MPSSTVNCSQEIKNIIVFLLSVHLTFGCLGQSDSDDTFVYRCLTQSDAEIILGQPVNLTESSREQKDSAITYRCTYTATKEEPVSGNTGHLYYIFEKFGNESSAKDVFAGLLAQNENMPNLEQINHIGDEAFSQTDNKHFSLLVLRRCEILIRLKVNRLTDKTSLTDLQRIAQQIAIHL